MSALPQPDDLVFVYGTLKRGGAYQWVMQKTKARYIGDGNLITPYPLILDRYPCLLDQPGEGFHVKGEVYRLPEPSGWEHLDWLEGHPQEYLRRIEHIRMASGIVKAWTYFYLRGDLLKDGLQPLTEFKV